MVRFPSTYKYVYHELLNSLIKDWNYSCCGAPYDLVLCLIGKPFRRYTVETEPHKMEEDIRYLLGEIEHPTGDSKRMPKEF